MKNKKLIFINGTMGVGKTATCEELAKLLRPNVFLDGDWCWKMSPFTVNDETKEMVFANICFLLNKFLCCKEFEYIIFCWVMHEQEIINQITSGLKTENTEKFFFTLTAEEEALRKRLLADVEAQKREADILAKSVARLPLYDRIDSVKIDVGGITPSQAARRIAEIVTGK